MPAYKVLSNFKINWKISAKQRGRFVDTISVFPFVNFIAFHFQFILLNLRKLLLHIWTSEIFNILSVVQPNASTNRSILCGSNFRSFFQISNFRSQILCKLFKMIRTSLTLELHNFRTSLTLWISNKLDFKTLIRLFVHDQRENLTSYRKAFYWDSFQPIFCWAL